MALSHRPCSNGPGPAYNIFRFGWRPSQVPFAMPESHLHSCVVCSRQCPGAPRQQRNPVALVAFSNSLIALSRSAARPYGVGFIVFQTSSSLLARSSGSSFEARRWHHLMALPSKLLRGVAAGDGDVPRRRHGVPASSIGWYAPMASHSVPAVPKYILFARCASTLLGLSRTAVSAASLARGSFSVAYASAGTRTLRHNSGQAGSPVCRH